MVVLDDDAGTGQRLADGDAGLWSSPQALLSLYERERSRADAVETRCEELRRAEVEARSRAGSLKWQLDRCRGHLRAAEEETKAVRRTAKDALALQGEVERLEKLLSQAGVASSKRSTMMSLRMDNASLRAKVRKLEDAKAALASRVGALEVQLGKLRSTRAVLSKSMFGRKSEQQNTPGTGRKRGQQRGAPGHGRTERPGLREKKEQSHPPNDARVCSRCAQPYVANGERCTSLVEVKVCAYTRKIVRPRYRRSCECASSPREVTAPPVARLFDTTPYGISVWVCILFERFVCGRPLHRVAAWLADMGLRVAPGTLADSVKRFVALFAPLAQAILAHQNSAALRHGDETSWRVQALREQGRSSRAWLWTSLSHDAVYYHIDPSRSAAVAMKLFGAATRIVLLVCDRFSAYKSLAHELDGKVVLCWCWAHQRRSFLDCAAGHVRLRRWCQGWVERIAQLYRLNDARLAHYDPGRETQTPQFDAAQRALEAALTRLFADAETELAGLADTARRAKALRSLVNHRKGLSVFVDKAQVPMDNNRAERALRGAVIGRRLSFGSDSEHGAELTAMMYSVVGTLAMNGIDVRRWLEQWLNACAHNGGNPPQDLSPWLPWSMSAARKRALAAPR